MTIVGIIKYRLFVICSRLNSCNILVIFQDWWKWSCVTGAATCNDSCVDRFNSSRRLCWGPGANLCQKS